MLDIIPTSPMRRGIGRLGNLSVETKAQPEFKYMVCVTSWFILTTTLYCFLQRNCVVLVLKNKNLHANEM